MLWTHLSHFSLAPLLCWPALCHAVTNGSNFIYLRVTHMTSFGDIISITKVKSPRHRGHHCLRLPVCCLEELKVRTRSITAFWSSNIRTHGCLLQLPSGPRRGSNMHVILWNWYMTQDSSSSELSNVGGSIRVASESRCGCATCRLLWSCCPGTWAQQISTPVIVHCELPAQPGYMLPSIMVFLPVGTLVGS